MEHDCNHISSTMPTTKDNILEFKNVYKQLRVPFAIYVDFESILKPVSSAVLNNSTPYTNNVQEHETYSFAYYIKCSYDESLNKFEIYRGPDAIKVFMETLKQEARRIGEILKKNVSMTALTPLEQISFHAATECSICNKPLGEDRVRDHGHLTGKFSGAAHSECNIKYKVPNFIPVVLHNLSGYDSHIIVKELAYDKESVTVVPNNKGRNISFTKNARLADDGYMERDDDEKPDSRCIQLRFIDSLRFMASSLDKLAKNLDKDQFVETRKCFPHDKEFGLVTFYNNLTSSDISFAEYSDLYLKTDGLLLADVFENFRNVCIKTYSLDPCQYLTAPSLSWDAMLKYTRVKLELLTDIEMHLLVKKGIRGGLVQCCGRYARANNKYMENFRPEEPSKYLTY